jgi:hypothetical protein
LIQQVRGTVFDHAKIRCRPHGTHRVKHGMPSLARSHVGAAEHPRHKGRGEELGSQKFNISPLDNIPEHGL